MGLHSDRFNNLCYFKKMGLLTEAYFSNSNILVNE